jgi:purine nucleoside phosphorylase
VRVGKFGSQRVAFLARHGDGHVLPPHRINYRANIASLDALGVTHVVALAAVGGIAPDCAAGSLVLPDQLIDYTEGRSRSFFEGDDGRVVHVDFTQPYDLSLREGLKRAAARVSEPVVFGGTYGCTNGPRLETAAEIRRMARDGCTVVGMTGMPEAALARERGLSYASLCVVANAAAGLGDEPLTMDAILAVLRNAMGKAMRVLVQFMDDESKRVSSSG